jgi:hypothetical protein
MGPPSPALQASNSHSSSMPLELIAMEKLYSFSKDSRPVIVQLSLPKILTQKCTTCCCSLQDPSIAIIDWISNNHLNSCMASWISIVKPLLLVQ